jgi:hypothetical protein
MHSCRDGIPARLTPLTFGTVMTDQTDQTWVYLRDPAGEEATIPAHAWGTTCLCTTMAAGRGAERVNESVKGPPPVAVTAHSLHTWKRLADVNIQAKHIPHTAPRGTFIAHFFNITD